TSGAPSPSRMRRPFLARAVRSAPSAACRTTSLNCSKGSAMVDRPVMVITGTRKGIGRFLAEHYTQQGFEVVGCSREPSDLDCPGYHHHWVDAADEPAVKQLFLDVTRQLGRLDVLLNNAGTASLNHCLLTPLSTARKLMETNFLGTFLFCREGAKLMQ